MKEKVLSTMLMLAAIATATAANDTPTYNFHGETDNTDIYAIPLDSSEEEQEEELESFEQYSQKHAK